jgi:branched-chain amino acid transport system permease protein
MVIIGGVGSVMGYFVGAAYIVLLPTLLSVTIPPIAELLHVSFNKASLTYIEFMIFGALIIFFLIVEPHGLARLWQITKEKLRIWPFPH